MKKHTLSLALTCCIVMACSSVRAQTATVTITPEDGTWTTVSPQQGPSPSVPYSGLAKVYYKNTTTANKTIIVSASLSLTVSVSPVPGRPANYTQENPVANSPINTGQITRVLAPGAEYKEELTTAPGAALGATVPFSQRTTSCSGDADITVNGSNSTQGTIKKTWIVKIQS
jgi:hypothetical protein